MLRIMTLVILMCCALTAQAQGWREALSGTRLIVGITTKNLDLDVQDPENPFMVYGSLTQGDWMTPLLAVQSEDVYFPNSRWGYYFELSRKDFYLTHQVYPEDPDAEPVDLGTSVSGSFYHLTPVLFYNWGDRHISPRGGQAFKFGIGLGMGYLQAQGRVIFTETTAQTHHFDVADFGTSIVVMMDYRYKHWYFRTVGGGPALTQGNYEYSIFDFSMDIGYIYTF